MADQQTAPPFNKKEEKKKGLFAKLEEITPDKEERLELISTFVRLGIVCWSGFILTLAYVDLPGFQKQNFDPTFIASVFTGALAGFSINTKDKKNGNSVSKEEIQKMMAANQASASNGEQIIRIQTPIKIQAPDGGEIQQVVQAPPKPPTPETKA